MPMRGKRRRSSSDSLSRKRERVGVRVVSDGNDSHNLQKRRGFGSVFYCKEESALKPLLGANVSIATGGARLNVVNPTYSRGAQRGFVPDHTIV